MDPLLKRRVRFAGFWATFAFALLAAAFVYWQVYRSDWLIRQPYNRHLALLERHIRRGTIFDTNGIPLAISKSGGPGRRTYPQGSLCAHVLGYLSARYGRTGIEGALDPQLSGMGARPSPLALNPLLTGQRKAGDNVYLTLDLAAQKAASRALGNRRGAVVALDPSTGRILALVSHPSFNPAKVDANWQALIHDHRRPLLDRALQGRYQPGSTFKVLTASAAVDTGTETPNDMFDCPGYVRIGRFTIHEMDHEVHGHLSLAQALAQSCNVTFSEVGIKLGADRLLEYVHRFWVDRPLDFILPTRPGQIIGKATRNGKTGPNMRLLAIPSILAQTAFGQGQVVITPLEDAMISAAVANHGILMKPYLVDRIVDPEGHVVQQTRPTILAQPIRPSTASAVTSMMELTFTEGTARHLQVPGLLMAGKTGTAQNPGGRTHAWFVGFAPADHPRVVAACVVENGGVGGVEAGPVVRATILAALRYRMKPG